MRLNGTPTSRDSAKRLRHEMTPPELALWHALRRRAQGLRFRRQHPAGKYVLDFYCAPARLAIEVDGEAHGRGDRPARDAVRDAWFQAQGIRVLRFTAKDVLTQLEAVVRQIVAVAAARSESSASAPPPSPPSCSACHLPLAGEDEAALTILPRQGEVAVAARAAADGGGGWRCTRRHDRTHDDAMAPGRAGGAGADPPIRHARLPAAPARAADLLPRAVGRLCGEDRARLERARQRRGFVTRFAVRSSWLDGHAVHEAGGRAHREYWIPAEELEAFNAAIVGEIEVVREFR